MKPQHPAPSPAPQQAETLLQPRCPKPLPLLAAPPTRSGPQVSRVSGHCPQLSSRLGAAEPSGRQDARYPDLLLLGGRVVAFGLSFYFPVAGQRVAARHGLDSIPRAVLTKLPAAQVDARGTPQLGEGGREVREPASPRFPALLDIASGDLCRLARSGASPSWSGPSPPAGGSTRVPAHSSCGCPPGPRWDSAAETGQRALWAPGPAGSPACGCRPLPGPAGAHLGPPRPSHAPPQLVLGIPPRPRPATPSTCLYLGPRPRPAPAPACTWGPAPTPPRPRPAPAPPQHLLVLGRQTPAAGLQPPVVVAHVLAHLAVLLALLLPPRGRRAVAGGEGRVGHWVCGRAPVPRGFPSWTCTAFAGRASDGSEATPAAAPAQVPLSPSPLLPLPFWGNPHRLLTLRIITHSALDPDS